MLLMGFLGVFTDSMEDDWLVRSIFAMEAFAIATVSRLLMCKIENFVIFIELRKCRCDCKTIQMIVIKYYRKP